MARLTLRSIAVILQTERPGRLPDRQFSFLIVSCIVINVSSGYLNRKTHVTQPSWLLVGIDSVRQTTNDSHHGIAFFANQQAGSLGYLNRLSRTPVVLRVS
jgi:hypothetical protein